MCGRCRRLLEGKDSDPPPEEEKKAERTSTTSGDEAGLNARITELEDVVSGLEDNIRNLAMENFLLKQQLDAKERQIQELVLGKE